MTTESDAVSEGNILGECASLSARVCLNLSRHV